MYAALVESSSESSPNMDSARSAVTVVRVRARSFIHAVEDIFYSVNSFSVYIC